MTNFSVINIITRDGNMEGVERCAGIQENKDRDQNDIKR